MEVGNLCLAPVGAEVTCRAEEVISYDSSVMNNYVWLPALLSASVIVQHAYDCAE